MNNRYLEHHGIKGMKWGVRRFQNKDGSYTAAGESRYKRGKRLSSELHDVSSKEYKKLKKQYQAEFDKYYKEAYFIAKKYGLDMDDGGGGDSERFTEQQLQSAGQRYMELFDKAEYLDDQISREARQNAEDYINKTYGDTAVSDIQHYNTLHGVAVTAAFLAVYSGFTIAAATLSKKK